MTTKEVCKLMGVTPRQLQHWDETELITPKILRGHDSLNGKSRDYSQRDLLKVGVTIALRSKRPALSLEAIKRVLRKLARAQQVYLLTDGLRIEFADNGHEVVQTGLKKFAGWFYLVDLSEIWERIRKARA